MYARIATFEGGDVERLRRLNEERMQSGDMNPPAGVKRVLLLQDADNNRRMFVTFFETRDDIAAAEQRFEAMGDEIPEDVRGRRTSVDVYEVVMEQEM